MRHIAVLIISTFIIACEEAAPPPGFPPVSVPASLETDAVAGAGDAADDPALWRAPDAANSRILGTDKKSGLYVYRLDGSTAQYIEAGNMNNIDVRHGFNAGGRTVDIAVASDRTNIALAVFFIDPETGEVALAPGGTLPLYFDDPYGLCLYQAEDALYAFVTEDDTGRLSQQRLWFEDGAMRAEEVRAAPGDDRHVLDAVRAEVERPDEVVVEFAEFGLHLVDGQRFGRAAAHPDGFAAERPERLALPEVEQVRDAGRVPEFGVAVEREVRDVQRQVLADERRDALVLLAGDAVDAAPDEAVVRDEQVGAALGRRLGGGDGGVDGERDVRYLLRVRPDLQAVRAGVHVRVRVGPEALVESAAQFRELHTRALPPP